MLSEQLKTLLATNYHFVIKTQFRHWNVVGSSFVQLHDLFGRIYEDAYSAIDTIAEEIRTLDADAPGSFTRFQELTLLEDQTMIPRARLMVGEQLADNDILLGLLTECFHAAEDEDKQDVANFMAERIAQASKWRWQLKALLDDEV